jgi:glycosyltransferase involved in cell wall biosynthesis
MKVIQILPELNAGGVERGTLELAAHLVREGHESIVISNGGRLVAALEKAGSRHIEMPVHRKSLASLGQVLKLRRVFQCEKPDIVHLRSRMPAWLAWLARQSLPEQNRPRLVTTVHGFYSVNAYSAIMTRGERVIAVSESVREYILENYPKCSPDSIRVVPRGITLTDYAGFTSPMDWSAKWREAHPQLEGKYVLLLPGRITRLKGHQDFFELVAALKQTGVPVHGLVVGDTHEKKRAYLDELKQAVRGLGISEEIDFLGHRGDLRGIMAVSNMVCALSQQPEAFGRTVLEALALGKAVVGYDCGGVSELLGHYFPAGRVPLGDLPQLIETARALIANRAEPAPVGPPFVLETMCRATVGVYKELTP